MKENDMSNIVVVDVSWASARDCREEYDRYGFFIFILPQLLYRVY